MHCFDLTAPLFVDWEPELVRLYLPETEPGAAMRLTIDGVESDFQYTGLCDERGAEVLLMLGFAKEQRRSLCFEPADRATTNLAPIKVDMTRGATLGYGQRTLRLAAPSSNDGWIAGPFEAFGGEPMRSRIHSEHRLLAATCRQLNDGPLFTDYEVAYAFADHRSYTLRLRCYRVLPFIEVAEYLGMGMGGKLVWTLNPDHRFDSILSHRPFDFESDTQPSSEPLAKSRTRDVLCRLQMPSLGDWVIPNNRAWFAFYDSTHADQPMTGVMGLYGARWVNAVGNVVECLGAEGAIEWNAALDSGQRHWLLYRGPVEREFTPEKRFLFFRLFAQFNALRLDEHLDLAGQAIFDADSWDQPAIFADAELHEQAQRRARELPPLRNLLGDFDSWRQSHGGRTAHLLTALLDPTPEHLQNTYDAMEARFDRWVRQFQGHRSETNDYAKNVIGFSRALRGLLISYEMLRKNGFLSEAQVGRLNAYFVFAARRISDEGRWPHTRSMLHPDHPESLRDLYTYGGEHKPDRLTWSNSLPNFQSDPLCALAHISALFADHPDAGRWRRLALDDLDAQLTAFTGKSGAWVESINYALYTLSYFVITFRVLKRRLGIDYFMDARMRGYVGWLYRFFGPYDKRANAWTWPGVGNAVLPVLSSEYLLCYASELPADDPLRADCLAIYQLQQEQLTPGEHYPVMLAAMAEQPEGDFPLRPLQSEVMDEVGVAMRHEHTSSSDSYLFQKIGFAKDHYEADESAFNWYAKGTPLCMDYGTYTADASAAAAHNLIEIPDSDPLRRGYLADHLFSSRLDYTRCEVPIVLKLMWGKVRSFDEIDTFDRNPDRNKTPYHYIGDNNPVGPKTWLVRQLLFVKPDYIALFDRVYGDVPHRYNLHCVADSFVRDGQYLHGEGRFDLDLRAFVQHPREFDFESGEFIPKLRRPDSDPAIHGQRFVRLYNRRDGIYRTVLFAADKEPATTVKMSAAGEYGIRVETESYTDYVFLHNKPVQVTLPEGISFHGCVGWIRRTADGQIMAALPDGEAIGAFGLRLTGRGPWLYNLDGDERVDLRGNPPRPVRIESVP